jgi:hypothetical protein
MMRRKASMVIASSAEPPQIDGIEHGPPRRTQPCGASSAGNVEPNSAASTATALRP